MLERAAMKLRDPPRRKLQRATVRRRNSLTRRLELPGCNPKPAAGQFDAVEARGERYQCAVAAAPDLLDNGRYVAIDPLASRRRPQN